MIDLRVGKYEDGNKKKSSVISTLLMGILILLLFLPLFSHMNPPPGQEGIMVNLGLPDQGQGQENAPAAKPEKEIKTPAAKPEPKVEKKPTPPKPVVKPPKPTPKPEVKKTIETVDPEAIALKKAEERKKRLEKQKAQEEADERERERQEELEREREEREIERREAAEKAEKARIAAEKARKAAAAKALKDKLNNQIGTGGSGSGKGNTGKPGSQGDPNGDPNSKILEGKSTGSGTVGGGLGSRGVNGRPKISDNTQKQGKIVLRVCVNKSGKVTSANYTQSGSNSADATLIRIATKNAMRWSFSPGAVDKQCGTITYDFKLK